MAIQAPMRTRTKKMSTGAAQKALFAACDNRRATIYDAARAYRALLRSDGKADWSDIDQAVTSRWSSEGYQRIRTIAIDSVYFPL